MSEKVTHEAMNQWADDPEGPVALSLTQKLVPAEGEGGVVFPPSYAPPRKGERSSYNIDTVSDGTRVATLDSVGAQANRMEPIFATAPYSELVPRVEIEYGTEGRKLSILDAGHRLGDAVVRCSTLGAAARAAFEALQSERDATRLAKLAPTSLVFGAWDSRDTQAKIPRIVQSVIRASDVSELTRAAQYNPALDYTALAVFSAEDKEKAEGQTESPLAQRGFVHVPATGLLGGVLVRGSIERQLTVNLIALRRLEAPAKAAELRRYVLGLALVAATAPFDGFLRQGCLLTPDPSEPAVWVLVARSGDRSPVALSGEAALGYARAAAAAFGVGEGRSAKFDPNLAKEDVKDKKAAKAAKKGAAS